MSVNSAPSGGACDGGREDPPCTALECALYSTELSVAKLEHACACAAPFAAGTRALHDVYMALAVALDATRLLLQAGRAIEHTSERGIMHQDLKPQNCMVSLLSGVLKLCDFFLRVG